MVFRSVLSNTRARPVVPATPMTSHLRKIGVLARATVAESNFGSWAWAWSDCAATRVMNVKEASRIRMRSDSCSVGGIDETPEEATGALVAVIEDLRMPLDAHEEVFAA